MVVLDRGTSEVQQARYKLLENRDWVDRNIFELQEKYKGKWVIVLDKAITATGDTPEDVEPARKGREDEALLMRIPEVIRTPI
ncbi:MAG: hypothetical protein D9V47_14685 [Clostridia bacterium]|nr:MAG: hypothetical protein D9V47_14685 [Clostridia bacterium]